MTTIMARNGMLQRAARFCGSGAKAKGSACGSAILVGFTGAQGILDDLSHYVLRQRYRLHRTIFSIFAASQQGVAQKDCAFASFPRI
ncbi:MAG: hypothetical protein AAFR44_16540 [Pseudomonadota bacterium]